MGKPKADDELLSRQKMPLFLAVHLNEFLRIFHILFGQIAIPKYSEKCLDIMHLWILQPLSTYEAARDTHLVPLKVGYSVA